MLGEPDPSVSDAALRALSTLIEAKRLQSGSKLLSEMNGIVPIINSDSSSILLYVFSHNFKKLKAHQQFLHLQTSIAYIILYIGGLIYEKKDIMQFVLFWYGFDFK